jgi:hypothetical protein
MNTATIRMAIKKIGKSVRSISCSKIRNKLNVRNFAMRIPNACRMRFIRAEENATSKIPAKECAMRNKKTTQRISTLKLKSPSHSNRSSTQTK